MKLFSFFFDFTHVVVLFFGALQGSIGFTHFVNFQNLYVFLVISSADIIMIILLIL